MTQTTGLNQRTAFDDWRSICTALYMTLVGYGVLVGIPVISTAWVELLGFSESQVGRVAGMDMGGLALGSLMASAVMARWNRRVLALVGLVMAVVANALCFWFVDYEAVLGLRLLSGTGSGIYTAVAVATLGGTIKPARAYNLMLFAFAFSQAGELFVLPMLPMNGIYGFFIVSYLVSLPLLVLIPARPSKRAPDAAADIDQDSNLASNGHRRVPAWLPWLCLTAIFFTYINIGSYWTYIELAGLDAGADPVWLGRVLYIVSLGSLVGCAVATLISDRWGLGRPLMITLVMMSIVVGILAWRINDTTLLISLSVFNLLWIFIDVYQMSTIAVIDRSGSFASLMPGAQGLGQIVGPNIAASMIGAQMGYHAVFAMCALAALVGMVIYAAMYIGLKKQVPEMVSAA